jgi:hypothetical protein
MCEERREETRKRLTTVKDAKRDNPLTIQNSSIRKGKALPGRPAMKYAIAAPGR